MICIASNNGWEYIDKCVDSCLANVPENTKITIIDTYSSDLKYREYLKDLCKKNNFNFIQSPRVCYDTGSYILSYLTYPNEKYYFFHQDSIIYKPQNVIQDIERKLYEENTDVVTWMHFDRNHCPFDSYVQEEWLLKTFGTTEYELGVYGPHFAIKNGVMKKLINILVSLNIDNKMKAQGMERGWAILFKKFGITNNSLENIKYVNLLLDNQSHLKYFSKMSHSSGKPRQ